MDKEIDETEVEWTQEQNNAWAVIWGKIAWLLFHDPYGSALYAHTDLWQSAYMLSCDMVEQDELLHYFED